MKTKFTAWCAALLFVGAELPFTFAAETAPGVGLKLVAEGFVSPLNLVSLPDGSGRTLIADQVGTVHVLKSDGRLADELFLDLRPKMVTLPQSFDERGLLGLALHPKFASNRRLVIYYSAPRREGLATNWNHTSHLSEFKVAEDFSRILPDSERVLLQIDEPQFNHNGGRIAFGPDGLLYIGTGDGGGANDSEFGHAEGTGNGQNTATLLGKILRIDIDRGEPYAIPSGNPFADGKQGKPEIFAYGLRNPWGISFDRGGARELFAVDVGQNLYEELNLIVKGGNYGWRVREGFHYFNPKEPNTPPETGPKMDARGQPFIDPLCVYRHPARNKIDPDKSEGISVTGGYIYRGKALPHLTGKYVFADWSRTWALPDGVLFAAARPTDGAKEWKLESLRATDQPDGKIKHYISAMGEDAAGELYLLTSGRNSLTGTTGKVFKLVSH